MHLSLTGLSSLALLAVQVAGKPADCKCFPGDPCWPSERAWGRFNTTVGGNLVKTVPLGTPCHDPHYDAGQCKTLQDEWKFSPVHINSSSSVQDPIFANASCDAFTPRDTPCRLGNYVRYAVAVRGHEDIAATLRFAEEHNIRLIIRNTGHDYMGRSTGAGALAIWTHDLKGVELKDWSDAEYKGKALKVAAGAQGFEVLAAAKTAGLIAVTGECPTVGVAGGYTQSGGHSPLSSTYGLSADNTLEFEVVTADGRLVTASPSDPKHADLFWALSGSGAGNYGVVVSVTLRAHADAVTSGTAFNISQPGLDYPALGNAWHDAVPALLDAGIHLTYFAGADQMGAVSITGFNVTQPALEKAMAPFLASLASLGLPNYQLNYTQFDTYHDHYEHYFGPLPAGALGDAGMWLMGGRLLTRQALTDLQPTFNATIQRGALIVGQAMNVSRFAAPSKRAVLPQWRDAAVMTTFMMPFSFDAPIAEMWARQDFITNEVMPPIDAATPGGGAYINEADFQQPDWQDVFFGANYPKLKAIKEKYDQKGLFYNTIAVGSENWVVESDGRLCKAPKSP